MDHYVGAIKLTNDSAVSHSNNHSLICISSLERTAASSEEIQRFRFFIYLFLLSMISGFNLKDRGSHQHRLPPSAPIGCNVEPAVASVHNSSLASFRHRTCEIPKSQQQFYIELCTVWPPFGCLIISDERRGGLKYDWRSSQLCHPSPSATQSLGPSQHHTPPHPSFVVSTEGPSNICSRSGPVPARLCMDFFSACTPAVPFLLA